MSVALAGRSLVSGGAQLQVGGFGDVEPVKAAELEQAGVRRGVVLILSAFRRPVAPLSCSIATDEPFSPGQRLLILRGTPMTVSSRDLPRPMPGRRGDSWSSVFCSGRVSGGDGCRSLLGGVPAEQRLVVCRARRKACWRRMCCVRMFVGSCGQRVKQNEQLHR